MDSRSFKADDPYTIVAGRVHIMDCGHIGSDRMF
jgi:hypothetical protein